MIFLLTLCCQCIVITYYLMQFFVCTARYHVENGTEILHCTLKFLKQVKASTLKYFKVPSFHWQVCWNSVKLLAPEFCSSTLKHSSVYKSYWLNVVTFLRTRKNSSYSCIMGKTCVLREKTRKNLELNLIITVNCVICSWI